MLRNFKTEELYCPCCKTIVFSPKLATRLQCLRDICGFPLVISSGYRCESHNSKIKGSAKASLHTKGLAVDVLTTNLTGGEKHTLLKSAFMTGFSGVGIYKNHIHLDLRKENCSWIT